MVAQSEGQLGDFFSFFGRAARHTGPQCLNQRSEPGPPAVEARSLNRWTAREVPSLETLVVQMRA